MKDVHRPQGIRGSLLLMEPLSEVPESLVSTPECEWSSRLTTRSSEPGVLFYRTYDPVPLASEKLVMERPEDESQDILLPQLSLLGFSRKFEFMRLKVFPVPFSPPNFTSTCVSRVDS